MNERTPALATCICGGGPAGMMLGWLLARAGCQVAVLEKHADFLRDFRGDTVHPSTLELMHELGVLREFLARPHNTVTVLTAVVGGEPVPIADCSHLPTICKFMALMPQWEFLNFVAEQAGRYPNFHLHMQTEATSLIEEEGQVVGVRSRTPDGPLEMRARLTVAADGRHSTLRPASGLPLRDLGAPMDVLWMRLPRAPADLGEAFGTVAAGHVLIMLDRGEYWQCGLVIAKGSLEAMRLAGIGHLRQLLTAMVPSLAGRVEVLETWDQVKLLTVAVSRLQRWFRPGLLCIGDAAHAMSPIGGVGINLAIQDAVAAANLLWQPLREGRLRVADLARVEARRRFPMRATQRAQLFLQNRVLAPVLDGGGKSGTALPWALRCLRRWPWLRRLPARAVGMGVRPEHVHSPVAPALSAASAATRAATPQ